MKKIMKKVFGKRGDGLPASEPEGDAQGRAGASAGEVGEAAGVEASPAVTTDEPLRPPVAAPNPYAGTALAHFHKPKPPEGDGIVRAEDKTPVQAGAPLGNKNAAGPHDMGGGETVHFHTEHYGTLTNRTNNFNDPLVEDDTKGSVTSHVSYRKDGKEHHSQVVAYPYKGKKERDDLINRHLGAFEETKKEGHKDFKKFGSSLAKKTGVMWSMKLNATDMSEDKTPPVKAEEEGHEFHGNQYTTANEAAKDLASKSASASKKATKTNSFEDHKAAMMAHNSARDAHTAAAASAKKAGLKDQEQHHRQMADQHSQASKAHFTATQTTSKPPVRSTDRTVDENVRAAHGEATGKPTISALVSKVTAVIQDDPRFDTDSHGFPEGDPRDYEPWCADILVPDDDGRLEAVIRTDDGRWVRAMFTWDGAQVVMDAGDPTETESTVVWAKALEAHDVAIKAAVPNPGDKRKASAAAYTASADARGAHDKAGDSGDPKDYTAAAMAHDKAADAHREASKARDAGSQTKPGDKNASKEHDDMAQRHEDDAKDCRKEAAAKVTASQRQVQFVHCRAAGVVISENESAKWAVDQPVKFQYMPGGVTSICAGYGDRAIDLTVECDEQTAEAVQASLEQHRQAAPKQKPFGCVEHREQEAALYPDSFEWADEPEPGVYCTATPSELGARNVNGRIHRSWSPSFTTDAEYSKAKCAGCDRAVKACECAEPGTMVFPKGARGHKDTPARITGVAFSVGSLTNKPAFKNILPVRAKEAGSGGQAVPQPENKHAEEKGPKMRLKFIKARGNYAAGSVHEVEDAEAVKAMAAGDALDAHQAEANEAKDVEVKAMRAEVKANREGVVKQAIVKAKARGAVPPKDTDVEVKAVARLEKLGGTQDALDMVVEIIDALPGTDQQHLTARHTQRLRDEGGNVRIQAGETTPQEAATHYVKAREPMSRLIQDGNIKAAQEIARETSAAMKCYIMPVLAKGGDFVLKDIIRAADVTDPDSQVGTLATGLVLMRNLGYLKNKLGWMNFISTDLRNEPAKLGQPVFTRYITPPGVLTFVPGTGYTSDATAISNSSSGTTQDASTTVAGTLTKSVPGATDVSVKIDQHKAVEIDFAENKLGGTARNLFAEQQGAQFYSLAEKVNQYFLQKLFAATWTGTVSVYTKALANFSMVSLVGLKNAMTIAKLPDTGRFALLHSLYHDKLLEDTNLLLAKSILAVINKDDSEYNTGELPTLYGIKPLESQLALALNGALGSAAVDAATGAIDVGANNQVGFAGNSASMLFVARVPVDYTTVLAGIPQTAALEIMTEPDSGLSIMFVKYINHEKASVSARCALMWGAAQGDPRQGIVIKPG